MILEVDFVSSIFIAVEKHRPARFRRCGNRSPRLLPSSAPASISSSNRSSPRSGPRPASASSSAITFTSLVPIAIVEAKQNICPVSHGMQQALGYADILDVPSAFSSNGDAFASHNKVPAEAEDIECEMRLEAFPSPEEIWKRYKRHRNITDPEEDLVLEPYQLDAYGKEPRLRIPSRVYRQGR